MNFFPVIVGVQPVQCWLVCQLLLDKAKVISGFDDGEDSFPVIGSVTLKRQIYVDCRFHESNLEHSRMTGMGQKRSFDELAARCIFNAPYGLALVDGGVAACWLRSLPW